MFKLDLSPTYWAIVRFDVQSADGLRRETHAFDAEFPRMCTSELEAFGKEVQDLKMSDAQAAARVLRNFRDIAGRDGEALPFNSTNMLRVLDQAGVAFAVLKAFRDSQPRAALGN